MMIAGNRFAFQHPGRGNRRMGVSGVRNKIVSSSSENKEDVDYSAGVATAADPKAMDVGAVGAAGTVAAQPPLEPVSSLASWIAQWCP